ncbi:MAG: SHOCT domain-containing protein [Phaeodactylibacter sp.]|nr:SHOCT domain-containing protein [Phaeodactylibacter sp.]
MRIMSIIGIVLFSFGLLSISAETSGYTEEYAGSIEGGLILTSLYGLALSIVYLVQHKRKPQVPEVHSFAALKELHNLFKEGVLDEAEYEARKAMLLS